MDFDQPPVVRVSLEPDHDLDETDWPMTIPAVAQLAREGLDLSPFVTFVVGENGSGKSTIVEAVAAARRTTWAELELVQHWKSYLGEPGRYLRHVLD